MAESRRAGTFLLAIMTLGVGVLLGVYGPRLLKGREEPKPLPDVITQVRELSRLEGVSYHVERVVDLKDKQQKLFGLVKAEDAILLVAGGDVTAGVDLGKLQDGDVVVAPDRQSVSIHLPPGEVFSAKLDNDRTYVHTRTTDLLAQRKESLETEARKAAERTLQSAAEDAGIVRRAEESVKRTVESLVRSLGFAKVTVDFRARA
ncbi:MAG TPA: DUF4230 domain-containing protein [Polyangiaceae bacterium]|nr:DUF4230 domain-containing protein [Polyangiaceae bacterium]